MDEDRICGMLHGLAVSHAHLVAALAAKGVIDPQPLADKLADIASQAQAEAALGKDRAAFMAGLSFTAEMIGQFIAKPQGLPDLVAAPAA